MRVVPDISAVGDPNTGMLIGQTQTFPDGSVRYSEYRIGGTSLSSPLAAGMLALAVQRRGAPIGFANPALYAIARTGAYYDITKLRRRDGPRRAERRSVVERAVALNVAASRPRKA